jgi:APA family basic amino acid/polyamine antiporter
VTATVAAATLRPAGRLQRCLGVWFGIAVGVGSMIGAGILRAPAEVAARLPSPTLFLGAWVIGALYALLGANAIAELATLRPRSGGQYTFVREALGPYAGFLVGWNDWLSSAASVAAVAIVAGEAAGALLPLLAGHAVAVATTGVAIVSVVLVRGIRASDGAQRLTSVLKAIAFLVLIGACLAWRAIHGAPVLEQHPSALPRGLALLGALAVALQGVIFAYDGWTSVIYYSGEVENPGREIPQALFGGLLSTMAIYLLINASFLAVLPIASIAQSPLAASSAASVVFGAYGAMVVQLVIVLAMPSSMVANLLNASRVIFAMGEDRLAPAACTRVNVGGTPDVAMVVSAIVAALFLLTGTFERLIALCAFLFVASYALSFAAVFVFRRREPDTPRPYRAWGHPWSTALVLAGSVVFLGTTLASDPQNAMILAVLIAASYPLYRVILRRRT